MLDNQTNNLTQIPNILYHYTKLENLTNIIRYEGGKVELVFWLTHFRQMADVAEGKFLKDIIETYFPEFTNNELPDMYILSLSEDVQSLPMWKEYANDANGIALALDKNVLLNPQNDIPKQIYKCEYNTDTNIRLVKNAIDEINNYYKTDDWKEYLKKQRYYRKHPEALNSEATFLTNKYSKVCTLFKPLLAFKDNHFSYENEYRLIVDGFYDQRIKFRASNNRFIEFREYHIDIKALRGIYIGSNCKDDSVVFVSRFLSVLALDNIPIVEKIDIPYRT